MARKIGLIVDGEGDFAAFRRRFPHDFRVVKTDGPRGHTASIKEIANKSRKQLLMLQAFRCERVVIVLDFEERPSAYSNFLSELNLAFEGVQCSVPISIAVPNQMIENWYLADIEFLSKQRTFLKEGLQQKAYEGKNGKAELKRLMKKGVSYSETRHGPELFEILRFEVARRHSSSLDSFLKCLGDSFSC